MAGHRAKTDQNLGLRDKYLMYTGYFLPLSVYRHFEVI